MALAASAIAYARPVVYSGPVYDSLKIEGEKIRLQFKAIGSGLAPPGREPLRGFAIAGADRRFAWADAKIEGNTVVVSNRSIPHPTAVRYAWADNPICNLYNREGLPAVPFRTDRE